MTAAEAERRSWGRAALVFIALCGFLTGSGACVFARHEPPADLPPEAQGERWSGGAVTVGPNGAFGSLSSAIGFAGNGDTIVIEAGTYETREITIDRDLRIVGQGGTATLVASERTRKGILVTRPGVTLYVQSIEFTGARNTDDNGAGIRHQGADLTVIDSVFRNNEMGILVTGDPDKRVTIRGSRFENNGANEKNPHDLYVRSARLLVVADSEFLGHIGPGHHIKSMATTRTIVRNTLIDDLMSRSSMAIDLSMGGDALIENNRIVQGPASENPAIVSYLITRGGSPGEVIIRDNEIVNRHAHGLLLRNRTDSVVRILGNEIRNELGGTLDFVQGLAHIEGNSLNGEPVETMPPDFGARAGTEGPDEMFGTTGDDRSSGLGGDDLLPGGHGVDLLFGGPGDDRLYGGNGKDELHGGEGNDILVGGRHGDFVTGGPGDDYLLEHTEKGNDWLFGGEGDDVIAPGQGRDRVFGGPGTDVVVFEGNYERYEVRHRDARLGVIARGDVPDAGRNGLNGIEKVQFADGVYDVKTKTFDRGARIVDLSAIPLSP